MKLLIVSMFILPVIGHAQLYTPGMYHDEQFTIKVKVMDEFIDRFNNNFSLYQNRKQVAYKGGQADRISLIKSLFNQQDTTWNIEHIQSFIHQVTDTISPVYLNFYASEWYAELSCAVFYRGEPDTLFLILKVEVDELMQSKWVIRGVNADFLNLGVSADSSKALPPTSHNTGFIRLDKALIDQNNFRNYLPDGFRPSKVSIFFSELRNGNLVFHQINDIRYHFLQVKGWLFTVEYFLRDDFNSGWLISALKPQNEADKIYFKQQYLNLEH